MPDPLPNFGEKLREVRKRANLSGEKLADLSGVALRTIRGAEKTSKRNMQPDTYDALVKVLAEKLGVLPISIDRELLGEVSVGLVARRMKEVEAKPGSGKWVEVVDTDNTVARRIPIGEEISAGKPIEGQPIEQGKVSESVAGDLWPQDDRAFGVRVRGHSMFPDYKDGDIVIASPGLWDQIEDGDDVCVLFTPESKYKGNRTLKRVEFLHEGRVRLHPLNPEHGIIEVDRGDIEAMGPVVKHVRTPARRNNKKWDLSRLPFAKRYPKNQNNVPVQEHPDYDGPDANYEP